MNQYVPAEKDRRLFKRYSLKKPCLVTGDNLVGLIKDISCGGCSFQYVKKRAENSNASIRELCLEPLGMAEVQVEIVEDLPGINEGEHTFATMYLRRVKFLGLSLLQMRSLQEYIRRNADFSAEEKTTEAVVARNVTILPARATSGSAVCLFCLLSRQPASNQFGQNPIGQQQSTG